MSLVAVCLPCCLQPALAHCLAETPAFPCCRQYTKPLAFDNLAAAKLLTTLILLLPAAAGAAPSAAAIEPYLLTECCLLLQVPIATSAAAITLEHEGYVVEPAIDFNQKAGYLSVAKAHDRFAFKGSYAFKEVRSPLQHHAVNMLESRSVSTASHKSMWEQVRTET